MLFGFLVFHKLSTTWEHEAMSTTIHQDGYGVARYPDRATFVVAMVQMQASFTVKC
jgi:predicted glutamine amidotransferase